MSGDINRANKLMYIPDQVLEIEALSMQLKFLGFQSTSQQAMRLINWRLMPGSNMSWGPKPRRPFQMLWVWNKNNRLCGPGSHTGGRAALYALPTVATSGDYGKNTPPLETHCQPKIDQLRRERALNGTGLQSNLNEWLAHELLGTQRVFTPLPPKGFPGRSSYKKLLSEELYHINDHNVFEELPYHLEGAEKAAFDSFYTAVRLDLG